MSDEEPPSTFDECESEEDARELIAQRYNNTVVEAMDEGFGPMFTAREFRDHAGATVVALHSTSVREQMDEGDEDHGGVLDGGEPRGSQRETTTVSSSANNTDDEHPLK